jgi:hypothetical protein
MLAIPKGPALAQLHREEHPAAAQFVLSNKLIKP